MALALYRRYRPDTFEGVIGQDQVTVPLMRALDEHNLTHAYLFSGPRGCGKTSSARILARCVNCVEGPTSHPCGKCESCKDLATGGPGSIDVVEIDAASHNGVEDARELRERAGFAPARDRYKIFILDEAHMVTPQGFNALLKIVEEPPEHVMFIFATTEPDKVIGTIRSRTHHYPFRLVPPEIMGPYLEAICEDEHIETEPGVLRLAMRAGGGSVRDTLSVFDQLMVGAVNGDITYDSAVALLGFTPDVLIGSAIDAIIHQDGAALYGIIQKVIVGGFDARRFVEDLLARTRDLLVLTLGGDQAERVLSDDAAAEDIDQLHEQAQSLGLHELTVMAETMDETLSAMAGAVSPRMRLELLAAKLLAGRAQEFNAPAQPAAALPASGAEPAQIAAQPASSSGFIGRGASSTQAPASRAPQVTAPSAPTPEHEQSHSGWPIDNQEVNEQSVPAATSQSVVSSAPAQHREQSAQTSNQTPDERWDHLVKQLPDDVQSYVNRTKVPRINLAPDSRTGRKRLWIKFDTPMSKYAFALAVSNHEQYGTNKVVDMLRAAVHEAFGDDVALAPTEKMADGQVAPPLSKLPLDQQTRIKAQLLQGSLQASVASMHADRESAATPSEAPAAQSTEESDPWAIPEEPTHIDFAQIAAFNNQSAATPASAPNQPVANAAGTHTATPVHGIDSMYEAANSGQSTSIAATTQPYDPADDPWQTMPTDTHQTPPAAPEDEHQQAGTPPSAHMHGSYAVQQVQQQQAASTPQPSVSAEDDEYSMSDESLASSAMLNLDEVKELFEVKTVEDFSADDPNNPRNLQSSRMTTHHNN